MLLWDGLQKEKKKEKAHQWEVASIIFFRKHSNPIILPIEEPGAGITVPIFKNNLYSFQPELSHYISLPYEYFSK